MTPPGSTLSSRAALGPGNPSKYHHGMPFCSETTQASGPSAGASTGASPVRAWAFTARNTMSAAVKALMSSVRFGWTTEGPLGRDDREPRSRIALSVAPRARSVTSSPQAISSPASHPPIAPPRQRRASSAKAEGLGDLAALHLAGRRTRQVVDDPDGPRHFERGEPGPAIGDELCLGHLVLQHDRGCDVLAEGRVRRGERDRLCYSRVAEQTSSISRAAICLPRIDELLDAATTSGSRQRRAALRHLSGTNRRGTTMAFASGASA